MQGNTRQVKRRGAVTAAAAMIAIVLLFVTLIVLLLRGEEDMFAQGILWFYVICGVAVVGGILLSLRQRFAEIRSGEEEEAKKY